MAYEHFHNLSGFFVTGINYKKSDALIRGAFAVNENQYKSIIENAGFFGVTEMFILSTCNRTEIYGVASDPEKLAELLCSVTKGDVSEFFSVAYTKEKEAAIEHLFNVAAGLDSQILGDYEIVGQLRSAVKFSKENNMMGSFTERLVNDALQSAKKIRTTTFLSGGTVSVSFAAIQFIRNQLSAVGKNILLIGTGKFGSNTCKNLVDHLPGNKITVINRTPEKANSLAKKYRIEFAEWVALDEQINSADIILVATHATSPVVNRNLSLAQFGERRFQSLRTEQVDGAHAVSEIQHRSHSVLRHRRQRRRQGHLHVGGSQRSSLSQLNQCVIHDRTVCRDKIRGQSFGLNIDGKGGTMGLVRQPF